MINITARLHEKLSGAKRVVFFTGAGMSAESGIPTYRATPERPTNATIKNACLRAAPNQGHFAITDMEELFPQVNVITQNIDILHSRASTTNILELHGNIYTELVEWGDTIPYHIIQEARTITRYADIFFIVGTTGIVYPAASLIDLARASGAYLVEINIEPTTVTPAVDETILGKAGDVLPQLVEILKV
ncbi:MAG: hypothetical protein NTZ48_05675 [Candidatus Omnitrophica bacterium]|nr:hypothetical protein [Candidatus Omnitrophota bacterium]